MKGLVPVAVIPGLEKEPERALRETLNELIAQVNLLSRARGVTALKIANYNAAEGEIVRIKGGLSLNLPRSRPENQGSQIAALVEGTGTVRVTATSSTVLGQTAITTGLRLAVFVSNGAGNWASSEDLGADQALITSTTQVIVGSTGPAGADGLDGPPGSDGQDGADGVPGPAGIPGANGATGATGAAGAAGSNGAPGEDGSGGSSDPFVHTPELATFVNGALVGRRQEIDLVQGSNVTLTPTVVGGRPTVTVAAAGGGGSGVVFSVNVDLGAAASNGFFDVTGLVGLTLNSPIIVQAGVNTLDPTESELQIATSGIAISTTAFRVYWQAIENVVSGVRTFYYVLPTTSIGSLTVQDDGVGVVSGVGTLNFTTGIAATTPGAGIANIAWTGLPVLDDGVSAGTASSLDFTSTTSIVAGVSGAPLAVVQLQRAALAGGDVTAPLNSNVLTIANDAVTNAKAANMAANTIKCNPTAGAADPQDLAISADSMIARLSGNLVNHALATLAGDGLDYAAGGIINVAVDNDRDIQIDGSTGAVFFSKSKHRHHWWEDFIHCEGKTITTSGVNICLGMTNWIGHAGVASGTIIGQLGENNHPGIALLSTSSSSGSSVQLTHGFVDLGGPVLAQDVYFVEAIFSLPTVTSIFWEFGLKDQPEVNALQFFGDSATDTTTHVFTNEGGSSTNTDTGTTYSAGAWNCYTIIQESAGTVDFYIDDILELSTSSNIPDGEEVSVFFKVTALSAALRTMELDYAAFQTNNLGNRNS